MPRLVVFPYKMTSEAAALLAKKLDCIRVYPDRDYRPRSNDVIINWGSGHTPLWAAAAKEEGAIILNHWKKVCLSICKVDSFSAFKKAGVPTPDWTQTESTARKWISDGKWVCCRQHTEGMDGAGLILARKPSEFAFARLYTKYVPIAREFRVYVFKGKVIDVLEKRRDSEALAAGKVDPHIRTETNHWVFCRSHVPANAERDEISVKAIAALGLDFGGVDVIQSQEDGRCFVLETNTAPGIGGTTVTKFAQEFNDYAAQA